MKPSCRRVGSSLLLLSLFSLCFWLALASPVEAHARLTRSEPERGSTVATAPGEVRLWFNELLDEGFNAVEIYVAGVKPRTNLAAGKPVVSRKDRTQLTVPVKLLSPGEYVVEWRVLSRDGHTAPGRMTFKVSKP